MIEGKEYTFGYLSGQQLAHLEAPEEIMEDSIEAMKRYYKSAVNADDIRRGFQDGICVKDVDLGFVENEVYDLAKEYAAIVFEMLGAVENHDTNTILSRLDKMPVETQIFILADLLNGINYTDIAALYVMEAYKKNELGELPELAVSAVKHESYNGARAYFLKAWPDINDYYIDMRPELNVEQINEMPSNLHETVRDKLIYIYKHQHEIVDISEETENFFSMAEDLGWIALDRDNNGKVITVNKGPNFLLE